MTGLNVGKKLLLMCSFLGFCSPSCGSGISSIQNELETKVELGYEHNIRKHNVSGEFTHDGIIDRIFFDEEDLSFYLERGLGNGTYESPPEKFYSIASPRLNIEKYLKYNIKEDELMFVGWEVSPYMLENGEILNSFLIDEQKHRKIRYAYSEEKKKMEIVGHITKFKDDFDGDGNNDLVVSNSLALYVTRKRTNRFGKNIRELKEIKSFRTSEFPKGTAPVNIYSCVNESDSKLKDILFETKEWMYRMRFSKEQDKWILHTKIGFETQFEYYGARFQKLLDGLK